MKLNHLTACVLVASIFATGCATKQKPISSLSNGYDKITIARADIPGASENESIRPDFVTEIKKNADVVTVLYSYQARPNQQGLLADKLIGEFRRMSGKVPGLVSFNLHKAVGGSKVINYAQFETKGAYEAWKSSSVYSQHLEAIRSLVQKNESELFEIVYILQ